MDSSMVPGEESKKSGVAIMSPDLHFIELLYGDLKPAVYSGQLGTIFYQPGILSDRTDLCVLMTRGTKTYNVTELYRDTVIISLMLCQYHPPQNVFPCVRVCVLVSATVQGPLAK